MNLRRSPLALAIFLLLHSTSAVANPPADVSDSADTSLGESVGAPVELRFSRHLSLEPPPATAEPTTPSPVFIEAGQISGTADQDMTAQDHVSLRRWGQNVASDWLYFDQKSSELLAVGKVYLQRGSDQFYGDELYLLDPEQRGYLNQARYQIAKKQQSAQGDAKIVRFMGQDQYRVEEGRYTTCTAPRPDWWLNVKELELDYTREVGIARQATLRLFDTPILYLPWLDFPLSNNRKSGFLPPVITTGANASLGIPYYWNIAPNYDATLTPRWFQKRGLALNSEWRYLQPQYTGELRFEWLGNDQLLHRDRHGVSWQHLQQVNDRLRFSWNVQHVSDNDYFRDLSDKISATSQTHLPREGQLEYQGGWWNLLLKGQTYQTLQDGKNWVNTPYRRLPQLALTAMPPRVAGLQFLWQSDYTRFSHPTDINAKRLFIYPQVSLPIEYSYGFFIPKVGWQSTRYTYGENNRQNLADNNRNLPTFTLDMGLNFERPWDINGQTFTHTLEPRLYYVRMPYRDQSQIPNFDTANLDFGFAQIFSENQFNGLDKVNNANQLTAAITSRLLDAEDGSERLRVAVAQRLYFTDQNVKLDGSTQKTDSRSDLLALVGGKVAPFWFVDAGWQYHPASGKTQKANLLARYQPENGKVLNLGYRYTRDELRQLDLATQWPLGGRWYGTGRINWSLPEKRLVEGLAGLEYNGGCWVFRAVAHRFVTGVERYNSGVMFQLEFNGLSQIGSNPLETLTRNILGYQKINRPAP